MPKTIHSQSTQESNNRIRCTNQQRWFLPSYWMYPKNPGTSIAWLFWGPKERKQRSLLEGPMILRVKKLKVRNHVSCFPRFLKNFGFKHERCFKRNFQNWSVKLWVFIWRWSTLLWEGRKCWYSERHNSRSIHPSTQATSNTELKTSNNISTDSTLLVENSFSTACGEKKVYKISILDRKSFNFESFILSPTPFASPPFSRDAHVVFAHAAAWPHFCWSRILIWKTFEELSDEQRHSWIWYASYHQLPGTWKHPFINGWQSIRWWNKYLHSKWFFNQKSILKDVV